eukprot:2306286-Rhodomonas_salina.1
MAAIPQRESRCVGYRSVFVEVASLELPTEQPSERDPLLFSVSLCSWLVIANSDLKLVVTFDSRIHSSWISCASMASRFQIPFRPRHPLCRLRYRHSAESNHPIPTPRRVQYIARDSHRTTPSLCRVRFGANARAWSWQGVALGERTLRTDVALVSLMAIAHEVLRERARSESSA